MDEIATALGGGILGVGLVIFGIVFAFVWIFLPFAIFGTKKLLRNIIARQEVTIELLRDIKKATRTGAASGRGR